MRNKASFLAIAGLVLLLGCKEPGPPQTDCADFSGMWDTYFGYMHLRQSGNRVSGKYHSDIGVIQGTVKGDTLFFSWKDHQGSGQGYFVMGPGKKSFTGVYKSADGEQKASWDGQWNGVKVSH